MRRIALILALALLAAGCGSSDEGDTPEACLGGARAYLAALESADFELVRLADGVPISDCLPENQSAGDLATVGATLVEVATKLNAQARQRHGAAATVQVGYLVGAVEKGASETHGIHAELLRRIEAAALYSPGGKPPPPPFDQRYRKGYAAGKDSG